MLSPPHICVTVRRQEEAHEEVLDAVVRSIAHVAKPVRPKLKHLRHFDIVRHLPYVHRDAQARLHRVQRHPSFALNRNVALSLLWLRHDRRQASTSASVGHH